MRRGHPVRLRPRDAGRHRRVRGGSGTVAKAAPFDSTFVLCTDRMRPPIPSTGAGIAEGHDANGAADAAARSARERRRAFGERPEALGGTLRARRGAQARHLADPAAPDGGPALPPIAPFTRAARDRL